MKVLTSCVGADLKHSKQLREPGLHNLGELQHRGKVWRKKIYPYIKTQDDFQATPAP